MWDSVEGEWECVRGCEGKYGREIRWGCEWKSVKGKR